MLCHWREHNVLGAQKEKVQKVFFNIVKDLFKSIEGVSRSGKDQIGFNAKKFIVLDGLR